MVKNRPHLITVCGTAAGIAEAYSYGQILLEKVTEEYASGWDDETMSVQEESKEEPNGLLSGTEWSTEEDDILREAVRTLQDADGACSSVSPQNHPALA
jgi:cytochrome c2